jgi:hypothetical protein
MRLLVIFILLLCASAPAQALEISNFRSGLACTNTSTRDDTAGWICHVTEDILVTDQGQCRYNGKEQLCTWVGFEFDYRGAQPGDQLECTMEQSQPTAFGNPKEELDPGATSQEFVLPLEKAKGHFYNPQYFTFTARPPNEALLVNTGQCSFQGKSLFKYTYRLRFPVLPVPETGA